MFSIPKGYFGRRQAAIIYSGNSKSGKSISKKKKKDSFKRPPWLVS